MTFENLLYFFSAVIITLLTSYFLFRVKNKQLKHNSAELKQKLSGAVRNLKTMLDTIEIVTESVSDAVIICDNTGKIRLWNPMAEEMFGFKKDELLHKDISTLDEAGNSWKFTDVITDVIQTKQKKQMAVQKSSKNELPTDLILRAAPISGDEKNVRRIHFSIHDIRNKNKLPGQYPEQDKIMAGFGSINDMLSALAHNLINSVSAINTAGQLGQMDRDYLAKFLDVSMIQVNKMLDVLMGLNDFREKLKDIAAGFTEKEDTILNMINLVNEFAGSLEKTKPPKSIREYSFHEEKK